MPWLGRPGGGEIISYDDVSSVKCKCRYVLDKNAAGVIIWEISQDFWRGKSALLEVIGDSFSKK